MDIAVDESRHSADRRKVPDEIGDGEMEQDVDQELPNGMFGEEIERQRCGPLQVSLDGSQKTGQHEIKRHEVDAKRSLGTIGLCHEIPFIIIKPRKRPV